jgi:DNA-binding CsgD family transcriptional regulator
LAVSARYTEELLEREAELAAIAELIGGTCLGAGRVILVEGAAGVGKTGLLLAVDELACGDPVSVLHARGGELEREYPFGVAAQLFAPALARLDGERRASVLSGAAEVAVGVVERQHWRESEVSRSPDVLYARLHGLYWMCSGLAAHQPLVLVIDDAHWSDEPSLQWLLFLTRRLRDLPVTMVLAARPRGAAEFPAALSLLADEPDVSVLRPPPLSEQASTVLVRRAFGEDAEGAFCSACHRASGGNPFLLTELLKAVRADGLSPTGDAIVQIEALAPEGIGRSVIVRLGRTSREAATLASALAVLGGEAKLRHAAALAGLGPAAASEAADALTAAGLADAGRPLRLIHPVVRAALYDELPAGRRALLHRRAAQLLVEDEEDLDAIAAHLLLADAAGERWTVEVLQRAAGRALDRGAASTAARYLARALSEPPASDQRAGVLRRAGVAESLVGDPTAVEHLSQAMALSSAGVKERADAALELSAAQTAIGRFGEAIRTLEVALEDNELDQESRWLLEARLIGTARIEPHHAEIAERYLARVPRDLQGTTRAERLLLCELAYSALIGDGHAAQVAELAKRALGGGQLVAEEPPSSPFAMRLVFALVLSEEHELAMGAYDQLLERAQRTGTPLIFALTSSLRSQLHFYRGEIHDAIADAHAALDASVHFGLGLVAPNVSANLTNALLEAGDIEGAERAFASCGLGDQIPELLWFADLIRSRGRLALAQGNTEKGIKDMLAGHELLARFGITNPAGTHCRSTAAVALAGMGRQDDARRLASEELVAARIFGAPSTVGISLRAMGVIEGGSPGIDRLRAAVAELERSPARLEHARALADLGAALRRAGKRREAQPALRQGLDLADRCGAGVIAERARAELLITGAKPRRARISGVESLTASERRVAQLAAHGLTNRQIAQALFVSHATVVTHLSHVYQKLNLSSREQLAGALGEQSTPSQA